MKKLIFKDGTHEREIVLREGTSIDELWYRTYRFQRSKGWFDFDWEKINQVEDARLRELVPDLNRFTYGGKVYVSELAWHCHLYSLELGANTITMADKLIEKFYQTVKQEEFNTQDDKLFLLLETIELAKSHMAEMEKKLTYTKPGQEGYTETLDMLRVDQDNLMRGLAMKASMRNPLWVPGVSHGDMYGNDKIKFAIFKHGAERSSCNITMKDCEKGLPDKIKKLLLKEIEKDPSFTYTFKMYLCFDYLDALPDAVRGA